MLKQGYRYISLDCETTGLDTHRDEIIQIALVEYDHTLTIQETFCSFVRPRDPSKLKHIIGFLTGISEKDLLFAPDRSDIKDSISKFFGPHSVIIGHNIGFDMKMISNYMNIEHYGIIDTFPLAQSLFPYEASYGLEQLHTKFVQTTSSYQHFFQDKKNLTNHHDALFDSVSAGGLLESIIKKIKTIIKKFPACGNYLHRCEDPAIRLIDVSSVAQPGLTLPPLIKAPTYHQKIVQKPSLINNQPSLTKFYCGKRGLKDIMINLIDGTPTIFAFADTAKLDCSKKICDQAHIQVGYLKEDFIIDDKQVEHLLSKATFNLSECLFLIKYHAHAYQGLSVLHLLNPDDYRLFFALKKTSIPKLESIILTTHTGLYHALQQRGDLINHRIVFFDNEDRYKSYNFILASPFDPLNFLQLLENCTYKYSLSQHPLTQPLSKLVDSVTVRIGVFYIECTKGQQYFKSNNFECPDFVTTGIFWQSMNMLKHLHQQIIKISKKCEDNEQKLITQERKKFVSIIKNPFIVQQKRGFNDTFRFTIRPTNVYTNYQEFCEMFKSYKLYFLSSSDQKAPSLAIPMKQKKTDYTQIKNLVELMNYCNTRKDIKRLAIICGSKQNAQLIFEHLTKENIFPDHKIVAEHITSSSNKIVATSGQQHEKQIIICGFETIIKIFAHQQKFDKYVFFDMIGPLLHRFIADLDVYEPETTTC